MRKTRFSETQIVSILREAEAPEATVTDICRIHGISQNTFYGWRRKYGGMDTTDVKRLKELEAENKRLKKLLAEASLEIDVIKEVLRGK